MPRRCRWRMIGSRALACGLALACAPRVYAGCQPADAEPGETQPAESRPASDPRAELERRALEAFSRGEHAGAEEALRTLIGIDPGNFVHYYNLACVRAAVGDADGAAELIVQAVEHGFADLEQLRHDPNLARAREHEIVRRLIDRWSEVLDRRIETDLARAREEYGPKYCYERHDALRLGYACSFDEATLGEARDELAAIHAWAMEHIFSPVHPEGLARPDDPWVIVVLPNKADFARWAAETYGPAARGYTKAIGGHYSHDEKKLVTSDLGATLRHEFMHVLHWRSNTRARQLHPIWVQEGLCSLIEDYDVGPGGELVPVESWRTNQARFLAETGKLPPLSALCELPRDRFTASRPLAQYAVARAVFLWLYRQGKLGEWYAHFVAHYREDPSGLASLEAVLGLSGEELDRSFREFARALPKVSEEIRAGDASLGVEIDATGEGEGLRVSAFVPRSHGSGLARGDILTHVAGRPTRDYWELVRVLTSLEPGQTVPVRYRRGGSHAETPVTLRASRE